MNKKPYKYKRFWLLLLIVAYLLFGFLYVPKIINQQLTKQLAEQLDMQAEMTAVKFNPLTFSTEIKGLKITDTNQQTWFDSQLTGINFDPLNLIWGEWKFSDLNLVQPKITLLADEAGQVLIPALPEFPESADTGEPINFSIDQIRLVQGRMNLQAGNIKKDFELNIKSIEISHDKFSLADEDTNFEIKVTTENDESIALKGQYNHLQQTINSDIQLTNWQATTLNQVLPNELAIKTQAGQIQATGNIKWLLSKNPLLNFSSIEVQALQSQYPKGRPWQNAVSFEQLQISIQQVVVDIEAQTIAIERIESTQGDWQVLWPLNSAESSMADAEIQDSSDVIDAETTAETADWQINIEQINITDWPVELIDREVDASITFAIQSLEVLKVNNLNQAFTVQSQLNFADSGQLNINSEQVLSPLDLNAEVILKQLSLKQIAPWITDQSGLVFTQGQLSTVQKLKLNGEHFDLTGDLSIKDANIENQGAQSIADWSELQVGATSISSLDQTIVIDQITLDQANGNIIIDSEKNLNVQNLKSSEAEVPETAPSDNQATDPSDWTIKIGAINLKDSSTALIDQSVDPAFDQTGLQMSMLIGKAPFTTFDPNDNNVTDWLSAQLTPEELATYQLEDESID